MLNILWRNETEKLISHKKYIVLLILDAVVCLVYGLLQLLAGALAGRFSVSGDVFDGMLMVGISFFFLAWIPFIAILASADLFSSEYHNQSIRLLLQRPVSRGQIFFSKCAAVYTLCVAFTVIHYLMLLAVTLVFGGSMASAGTAVAAYLLDLIPLITVIFFFALLHQIITSPGSATAVSLALFLICLCLSRYVAGAGMFLFSGYLTWHTLLLGASLPLLTLLPKIGILAGSALIFSCAGYELFRRKGF